MAQLAMRLGGPIMEPEEYVLRSPGRLDETSMATPHVAGVASLWAQRQLETLGAIDSVSLAARVIANSPHGGLAPAIDAADVASGMVQAPAGG